MELEETPGYVSQSKISTNIVCNALVKQVVKSRHVCECYCKALCCTL